jgi:predicted amidohydrolase YtcJ
VTDAETLVIRNVEVAGRAGLDVRVEAGRIAAIGRALKGGQELDGRGGALIPGLADHHIHLFGLAARSESVDLSGATPAAFAQRMARAIGGRPPGAWVRAINYHESMAGELTRRELDALAPRHPLRVQHQTGALWILNTLALNAVGGADEPPELERDANGQPTGRIWRGDAWLRSRIGAEVPPLAPIGRALAALGVTAVTDASVTNDAQTAALFSQAARSGVLPQRLTLMSGGRLEPAADGAFAIGPVKVLLDEHDLPPLDDFVERIVLARTWGRKAAVHCVTAAELALTLAAFEASGAEPGDRIEHGGVVPETAIEQLRALALTVVTQPGFVRERGDRYISDVDPPEQGDLYRCASLRAAGVPVAASSDAPYGPADPWIAMATAVDRLTCAGRPLGPSERVSPTQALSLYLDHPAAPGRVPRRIAVGAPADLCLLRAPLRDVLAHPGAEMVRATLIGASLVHRASDL